MLNPLPLPSYLVLVKDVEDEGGKLSGIAEGEELLVDLLEASGVQLSAGTVLDEALIPGRGGQGGGVETESENSGVCRLCHCRKVTGFPEGSGIGRSRPR